MEIGLIGLGRMGYNLGLNILDHEHQLVAYDVNREAVKEIGLAGAKEADSLEELVSKLSAPRKIWVMVPAGDITENVVSQLSSLLDEGDVVIDGGNANYKDTLRRAKQYEAKGLHFVDAGTSGGIDGAREGACLMVGGTKEVVESLAPLLKEIAVEDGYLYTGPVGSGHFLKMIHNGIEYGMMQAIAEGFDLLENSPFDYDYEAVAKVWNNGSVIRSWLMELTESAFSKDANLEKIRGVMHSSGEGKWTVETALDLQIEAPVIALSLMMRYRSLRDDTFSGKVVAALRNEFGGHAVVKS
ncbi:decarboxylating 6-phosphogluconate dehydrogenase [Halalkalibacterium halodurans]|jgi:6-phosphogluconate dehydrogenase|uniref:6-phosphogluconate dehydrogenase n=2 Tax=Halalkalibacterium halodurans TaxID=86665 RepID=Q9K9H3_HALH5|nr:decarboxylating 6-phosphogluconate dehydrogenase [Halalkalibacterium halodurans]MDY7223208.1 decarboxylating 6-phosphogluconate dehydrogenase [Halalkalibacterium halodurans]MDY7242429.1 decarboxylating 6-phosphogluconate dehydrogenase [Halalkalibacterium halodurans]MED3646284.1 decarboxylating 6-phosphogluconate dehydrogenase [Halalkalibacterium halodurans]MED4081462.1 decarboxylating 6-phosphogluconate dehydrogenase [Halalkalibacterium halodurans]MED4086962.1 decarboxylating 6-phosphogluco